MIGSRLNNIARLILGMLTILASVLLIIAGPLGYWYVSGLIKAGLKPAPYFGLLCLSCFVLWGALYVFYIIHVRRTSLIPLERRRYWQNVLLVFNILAFPIYWYRIIWKQDS